MIRNRLKQLVLVKNPSSDRCGWPILWGLQHSTKYNQFPTIQRTRTQGTETQHQRGSAWMSPDVTEQQGFFLGSPANDLTSILKAMSHSVLMCRRTAKKSFQPSIFCNTESRNTKQVSEVCRWRWALPHCLSTSLGYPCAPRSVALQRGVLAVPWSKLL